MSKFDLAAAQRGDPIESNWFDGDEIWKPVKYVGIGHAGYPVLERVMTGEFFTCLHSQLRMAPKKVTMRYRVGAVRGLNAPVLFFASNDDQEWMIQEMKGFISWLTDWQTVEVPQGGE